MRQPADFRECLLGVVGDAERSALNAVGLHVGSVVGQLQASLRARRTALAHPSRPPRSSRNGRNHGEAALPLFAAGVLPAGRASATATGPPRSCPQPARDVDYPARHPLFPRLSSDPPDTLKRGSSPGMGGVWSGRRRRVP
ncbi:hypothetical protein [Amycolatopsis sp. MEPSY49]|uniref:hypothetical protein n=1 Tax=Amycolatopsis sp. MEPSY49 TaxID=3151600 RepID=UPI003EF5FD21